MNKWQIRADKNAHHSYLHFVSGQIAYLRTMAADCRAHGEDDRAEMYEADIAELETDAAVALSNLNRDRRAA